MSTIAQRLLKIKATLKPYSTHLLAVSKNRSVELIRSTFEAGQMDFGENKVQEALPKIEALSDLNLTWHFIGRLQTNKLKIVASHFSYLHSLCHKHHAQKLQMHLEQLNKSLNIFIQINISNDPDKDGLPPKDKTITDFLEFLKSTPNLNCLGFMAILQHTSDMESQRADFKKLKELQEKFSVQYPSVQQLSMGMSQDYQIAIEEGATWVRLGTVLFETFP